MIINVKVKTNSGKQEIMQNNDKYLVYLKSPPENNKANIELINLLKKYFGKPVKIVKGLKSKQKMINIG